MSERASEQASLLANYISNNNKAQPTIWLSSPALKYFSCPSSRPAVLQSCSPARLKTAMDQDHENLAPNFNNLDLDLDNYVDLNDILATDNSQPMSNAFPTQPHTVPTSDQNGSTFPCPIFEADIILGRDHVCSGVEGKPAAVRRHMLRNHVSFLKRCPSCKKEITDQTDFDRAHGVRCTISRPQLKGEAAIQPWIDLYRSVNPLGTPLPASSKCMCALEM